MTVSHPFPDVRDGLSLVHRRVLLSMRDAGLTPDRPYARSAAIARDVYKRFRPRARDSAYDALVAMVQDFTSRYPLVEGYGNFGSIDGDSAAAPQYTELGLSRIGSELLADADRTDGSAEPVLGAAIPNLLVNGSANSPANALTNIPPHNLREVVSAAIFLIDHPEATASDLRGLIPGPDFPTGALIEGHDGIKAYQETGRGRLTIRARTELAHDNVTHRWRIIITELPYGIVVEPLETGIATLVHTRQLEGITDLRNESDRDEMRIVVTLERDLSPEPLLRQLYELTAMQRTLDIRMAALVPQSEAGALVPTVLTLKQLLEHFIAHRDAIIARKTGGHLSSKERLRLIKDDLTRIANVYGDRRRTEIRGES